MGLDMYLNKTKRLGDVDLMFLDPDDVKENNPALYERLVPYMIKQGTPGRYTWDSYYEEVGYWRKANHIHNWFVENVQGGTDDCDSYEVSREKIVELQGICKTVIENSKLVDGKISNGSTLHNGKWEPIFEDGGIIKNPEIAMKLLPTSEGFFFGSTDYDEYYLEDVKYTLEICNQILSDFDFENDILFYRAS